MVILFAELCFVSFLPFMGFEYIVESAYLTPLFPIPVVPSEANKGNIQQVSARRALGGADVRGFDYDYTYDAIGNRVFVAKTPEVLTYDADGNMTSDERFTYTWNDENRMVMASNAEVCVTYAYDHKGRMIRKTISRGAADRHLPLGRRKMLADRPAVCNNFLCCPNHSRRPGGRNGVQTDGVK